MALVLQTQFLDWCLSLILGKELFIYSGNVLTMHTDKHTHTYTHHVHIKADKIRGGRRYQGMDRLGVQQVPEGSGEQGGNWLHSYMSCSTNNPRQIPESIDGEGKCRKLVAKSQLSLCPHQNELPHE